MDKITFKDWLLALIGLFFVLSGLFIIQKDFNTGITVLVFFGACFAVSVQIIVRKLRLQRQSVVSVTVSGGEPIRPSRKRIALISLGLLAMGSIMAVFQPDNNRVLFAISLLVAATGAVLLVGLCSGLIARSYIQFDPAGLTFGYLRGKVTLPWQAITHASRGEIHNNQAVFLSVAAQHIVVEPASYQHKVHKQMASSQRWIGADFIILCSTYALDAPVLLAAIERYMTQPEARAELNATEKLNEN